MNDLQEFEESFTPPAKEKRVCARCPNKLSETNPSHLCYACQKAMRDNPKPTHRGPVTRAPGPIDLRAYKPQPEPVAQAEPIQAEVPKRRGGYHPPRAGVCQHGCGGPRHNGLCREGRIARGLKVRGMVEGQPGRGQSTAPLTQQGDATPSNTATARAQAAGNVAEHQVDPPAQRVDYPSAITDDAFDEASRQFTDHQTRGGHLDTLKSKTIKLDEIPPIAREHQKAGGRVQALWAKLLSLKPGEIEAVECRDIKHTRHTVTTINRRARKEGYTVYARKDDKVAYIRIDKIHLKVDGNAQ